jgi:hypothetical protein
MTSTSKTPAVDPLTNHEFAEALALAKAWQRANPELELIRLRELRAMTERHGAELFARLSQNANAVTLRTTSGLARQQEIFRASLWYMTDAESLRTCSAEDLVIMKVFAARDKDGADVTSILERQGKGLDLDLIRTELAPLLAAKEEPGLAEKLEARIQKHIGN